VRSNAALIFRHILPNILPTIIVLAAMTTAGAISLKPGSGYLGIGVPPPAPTWGTMNRRGAVLFHRQPPMIVNRSGSAIVLTVLGVQLDRAESAGSPGAKAAEMKLIPSQTWSELDESGTVLRSLPASPACHGGLMFRRKLPGVEALCDLAFDQEFRSLDPAISFDNESVAAHPVCSFAD
jgi:hypothetical protein